MSTQVSIQLYEIVGSPLCIASDDGQKVHDQIAAALRKELTVTLSFLNVEGLTSAFLNAAVGQLYGEFSAEQIRANLSVSDMQPDDLVLLKKVVETAKDYFKDPSRFKKAQQEVLGDNDAE